MSILLDGGERKCRIGSLESEAISSVGDFVSRVEGCRKCDRRFDCKRPVLPQFVDNSFNGFMFVGRDPSILEDKSGKIFNKKSPHVRILEYYFKALGVVREESYLTNSVFCHGYENRKPDWSEVYACSNYKMYEVESILGSRLKHVVLMGDDACRQFLGEGESIAKHVGMRYILDVGSVKVSVVVVNHPGYLLFQRGMLRDTLRILKDYRGEYVAEK